MALLSLQLVGRDRRTDSAALSSPSPRQGVEPADLWGPFHPTPFYASMINLRASSQFLETVAPGNGSSGMAVSPSRSAWRNPFLQEFTSQQLCTPIGASCSHKAGHILLSSACNSFRKTQACLQKAVILLGPLWTWVRPCQGSAALYWCGVVHLWVPCVNTAQGKAPYNKFHLLSPRGSPPGWPRDTRWCHLFRFQQRFQCFSQHPSG